MLSVITLKLMILPSLIYQDCKSATWFIFLLMFVFEISYLVIFMAISVKNPDMTFKDMLEKMFGVVVAKVVLFLYLLFFMLKATIIYYANYTFLIQNLYGSLEWYFYIFPMAFVAGYVALCGLRTVGRMTEFFFPVIMFGAVVAIIMGVTGADFSNILPLLDGFKISSITPIYKYALWFGDAVVFLLLMGHIDYKEKPILKTFLSMAMVALFVCFFIVLFMSIFGSSSIIHNNAICDVVQVLPADSDIGNLGWILILVWDMALFIYFSIMIITSLETFRGIFTKKLPWLSVCIILSVISGAMLIIGFDISKAVNFFMDICCFPAIALQYVLPLIFLIFTFRLKEKKQW